MLQILAAAVVQNATASSAVDYAIVAAYLLGMLGLGAVISTRIKGFKDYFLAGGVAHDAAAGLHAGQLVLRHRRHVRHQRVGLLLRRRGLVLVQPAVLLLHCVCRAGDRAAAARATATR